MIVRLSRSLSNIQNNEESVREKKIISKRIHSKIYSSFAAIFLVLLPLSLAFEWQCRYDVDSTCKCYTCDVTDKTRFEPRQWDGKSNDDVMKISLKSKRSFPSDLFKSFPNAEIFSMSMCHVSGLSGGQFQDKSMKLKEVHGNLNRVTELGANAFEFAPNLEKIDFKLNQMKVVHKDAFKVLSKLKQLTIASNFISTLDPSTFNDLTSLEVLNVGDNKITTLLPNLFKNNRKLKQLTLSDNQINSINPQVILEIAPDCMVFLKRNTCINKSFKLPGVFDETLPAVTEIEEKCFKIKKEF